jgi:hypothetical protein
MRSILATCFASKTTPSPLGGEGWGEGDSFISENAFALVKGTK